MTSADVFMGLAYSAAGFIGGYFVGTMGREVHEVREAVMTHTPGTSSPKAKRGILGARSIDKIIALVLVTLAVASTISTGLVLRREAAQVKCQTKVNRLVADGLIERARVASNDRQAIVTLVQGLLDIPPSLEGLDRRTKIISLEQAYLTKLTASDVVRAENPISKDPLNRCPK